MRREQAREAARAATRRGLCARCQRPGREHPGGRCPDRQGAFQWALDESDLNRAIEGLERIEDAPELVLTRDEERVLDHIVGSAIGFPSSPEDRSFRVLGMVLAPEAAEPQTPESVAKALGLPLHHVRAVMNSLALKGCLVRASRPS